MATVPNSDEGNTIKNRNYNAVANSMPAATTATAATAVAVQGSDKDKKSSNRRMSGYRSSPRLLGGNKNAAASSRRSTNKSNKDNNDQRGNNDGNAKNDAAFAAATDSALPPPSSSNNRLPRSNVVGGIGGNTNKKDNNDNNNVKSPTTSGPTAAAPHLYAEINVPYKKKHVPLNARQSSTKSNATDGDGDVSLALTSISSLTGRASLFGYPDSNINGATGMIPQVAMGAMLWGCTDQVNNLGGLGGGGGGGDEAANMHHNMVNRAAEENYFDYSAEEVNHGGGTSGGNGDPPPSFFAGSGDDNNIIGKLLGAWNEAFKNTCQCFDNGSGGVVGVGSNLWGSGTKSASGGIVTTSATGNKSVTSGGMGTMGATIMETVNDTTATIANTMRSSASPKASPPTFSEPMEI